MTDQPDGILFGTDPSNQTITLYFGLPTTRLILTPEQAEAIAKELTKRAKLLRQQQSN